MVAGIVDLAGKGDGLAVAVDGDRHGELSAGVTGIPLFADGHISQQRDGVTRLSSLKGLSQRHIALFADLSHVLAGGVNLGFGLGNRSLERTGRLGISTIVTGSKGNAVALFVGAGQVAALNGQLVAVRGGLANHDGILGRNGGVGDGCVVSAGTVRADTVAGSGDFRVVDHNAGGSTDRDTVLAVDSYILNSNASHALHLDQGVHAGGGTAGNGQVLAAAGVVLNANSGIVGTGEGTVFNGHIAGVAGVVIAADTQADKDLLSSILLEFHILDGQACGCVSSGLAVDGDGTGHGHAVAVDGDGLVRSLNNRHILVAVSQQSDGVAVLRRVNSSLYSCVLSHLALGVGYGSDLLCEVISSILSAGCPVHILTADQRVICAIAGFHNIQFQLHLQVGISFQDLLGDVHSAGERLNAGADVIIGLRHTHADHNGITDALIDGIQQAVHRDLDPHAVPAFGAAVVASQVAAGRIEGIALDTLKGDHEVSIPVSVGAGLHILCVLVSNKLHDEVQRHILSTGGQAAVVDIVLACGNSHFAQVINSSGGLVANHKLAVQSGQRCFALSAQLSNINGEGTALDGVAVGTCRMIFDADVAAEGAVVDGHQAAGAHNRVTGSGIDVHLENGQHLGIFKHGAVAGGHQLALAGEHHEAVVLDDRACAAGDAVAVQVQIYLHTGRLRYGDGFCQSNICQQCHLAAVGSNRRVNGSLQRCVGLIANLRHRIGIQRNQLGQRFVRIVAFYSNLVANQQRCAVRFSAAQVVTGSVHSHSAGVFLQNRTSGRNIGKHILADGDRSKLVAIGSGRAVIVIQSDSLVGKGVDLVAGNGHFHALDQLPVSELEEHALAVGSVAINGQLAAAHESCQRISGQSGGNAAFPKDSRLIVVLGGIESIVNDLAVALQGIDNDIVAILIGKGTAVNHNILADQAQRIIAAVECDILNGNIRILDRGSIPCALAHRDVEGVVLSALDNGHALEGHIGGLDHKSAGCGVEHQLSGIHACALDGDSLVDHDGSRVLPELDLACSDLHHIAGLSLRDSSFQSSKALFADLGCVGNFNKPVFGLDHFLAVQLDGCVSSNVGRNAVLIDAVELAAGDGGGHGVALDQVGLAMVADSLVCLGQDIGELHIRDGNLLIGAVGIDQVAMEAVGGNLTAGNLHSTLSVDGIVIAIGNAAGVAVPVFVGNDLAAGDGHIAIYPDGIAVVLTAGGDLTAGDIYGVGVVTENTNSRCIGAGIHSNGTAANIGGSALGNPNAVDLAVAVVRALGGQDAAAVEVQGSIIIQPDSAIGLGSLDSNTFNGQLTLIFYLQGVGLVGVLNCAVLDSDLSCNLNVRIRQGLATQIQGHILADGHISISQVSGYRDGIAGLGFGQSCRKLFHSCNCLGLILGLGCVDSVRGDHTDHHDHCHCQAQETL